MGVVRPEEIEKIARQKPFRPFVVEMIDGTRYRFKSPENFFVSRSAIHTLDRDKNPLLISLVMIAAVRVEPQGDQGPEAWMIA
jgi:hypothetical protein